MYKLLRTEEMQKIRVLALESDKQSLVSALHKLGVVEFRKVNIDLQDSGSDPAATTVSEKLIRINGILQILGKPSLKEGGRIKIHEPVAEAERIEFVDKVFALEDERRGISEDMQALAYAEMIGNDFSGIDIDFGRLYSSRLSFKAYRADKKIANEFRNAIGSTGAEIVEKELGKNSYLFFVALEKKREEKIAESLEKLEVEEIDLKAKYIEGTPSQLLTKISELKGRRVKRLNEIKDEFENFRKEYFRLLAIKEALEIELARFESDSMFKKTEKTIVMEGWAPKKRMHEIKHTIDKATSGRYHLEEIESNELAPSLVVRPSFLKPFDYLMEFMSVPRSDEIDPTWIFIISFPIFYGLMISDVGYGIASFLFATWITTRTNPEGLVYNTAKIWRMCSVSAIFFGILSNQYLGFSLGGIFASVQIFDWIKNATSLIAVTILFGVVQVILGLVFGFINSIHHNEKKLAISKVSSITMIIFGTLAVGGAFFSLVPGPIAMVSAAVAVLSFVITLAFAGHEAAEITNLLTHPLSYSRIMGFGLGSIIIGLLIDKGFAPSLSNGIPLFILYSVIFILLHFANMIMGMFEGAVQGVRLNFVEFFTKFYKGGGTKFRPFAYKRVYTEE